GQDFQRPQTSDVQWLPIQGEQAVSHINTTPYSARWWEIFRDPQLSSLIDRAAASNPDLKMAEARLAQSRAARQVIAGEQVPSVDGKLGYQRKRNSAEGLNDPSGNEGRAAFSQWDGGINASWEVDLWGRVKREVEAADANVDVADNDRRAALLSLQAEVARDY
ncbi:TolC family protein, partial [Pseudomonas viridiflava]|uniref:TolC family protein n=1 Tax=Pseudomonas viridiflava TaxID=33069 RepID=UPI0013C2FF26